MLIFVCFMSFCFFNLMIFISVSISFSHQKRVPWLLEFFLHNIFQLEWFYVLARSIVLNLQS